jgi:two-component system phosphate regulon response regulator PhoB
VLLDWMLPVMSGIEVCRQIRRRPATRDLPVIMVTARTEDQDAVRGLNTGADDYITKPFNMEALLARMRALLRRSNAVPAKGQLTFHDIEDGPVLAPGAAQRPPRASGPDRVPAAGILHAASAPGVLARGIAGRGVGAGHPCRAAHGGRAYPPAAQVDQYGGELDVVRTVRAAGYALDTEPVVIYPHRGGMHGPVVGRPWSTLDRTRSRACPKPSSLKFCKDPRN